MADILTFSAYAAWLAASGLVYGLANLIAASLAMLGIALLFAAAGAGVCVAFDLAQGSGDPVRALALACRALLVWGPIAVLVPGLAARPLASGWRMSILAIAFVVQMAIQRLSMTAPGHGLGNVVASIRALSGSAAITFVSPGARRARPA